MRNGYLHSLAGITAVDNVLCVLLPESGKQTDGRGDNSSVEGSISIKVQGRHGVRDIMHIRVLLEEPLGESLPVFVCPMLF